MHTALATKIQQNTQICCNMIALRKCDSQRGVPPLPRKAFRLGLLRRRSLSICHSCAKAFGAKLLMMRRASINMCRQFTTLKYTCQYLFSFVHSTVYIGIRRLVRYRAQCQRKTVAEGPVLHIPPAFRSNIHRFPLRKRLPGRTYFPDRIVLWCSLLSP